MPSYGARPGVATSLFSAIRPVSIWKSIQCNQSLQCHTAVSSWLSQPSEDAGHLTTLHHLKPLHRHTHHILKLTAASAAEKKWRSTYYYGPGGRVGRPRRGSFLCLVLCGRWGVAARRELGRAHCISESPGRLTLLAADVGRASSGSVGPSGCCRGRAWWAGRTVRPKRALQAVQVWVQAGAAQVACGGPADVAQAFLAGRVEGARRQVLPV